MKKTLVALAALAVTSAFAQVTITGTAAYGYRVEKAGGGATTSGLGIDTASVTFAASEDLGGGTKVSASMVVDTISRAKVAGGDFDMAVEGGFGKLAMGMGEGSDYLSGEFVGLDGKVFSSLAPAADGISYTTPELFTGFKLQFAHGEDATTPGALGLGAAGTGEGLQRANTISGVYAAGALKANVGFRSYDNQDVNGTASKTRTRARVSYDLGVAKLGAGYVTTQRQDGTRTDTNLGVSIPLGALSLAADYGWRKETSDATRSGYGIVATYSLSKRTSFAGKYYNWQAAPGADASTRTDLILAHSF